MRGVSVEGDTIAEPRLKSSQKRSRKPRTRSMRREIARQLASLAETNRQ